MAGKKKSEWYATDEKRKEARKWQNLLHKKKWRLRGDTAGFRADRERSKRQWAAMKEEGKYPKTLVKPWLQLWDQFQLLPKAQQQKFMDKLNHV